MAFRPRPFRMFLGTVSLGGARMTHAAFLQTPGRSGIDFSVSVPPPTHFGPWGPPKQKTKTFCKLTVNSHPVQRRRRKILGEALKITILLPFWLTEHCAGTPHRDHSQDFGSGPNFEKCLVNIPDFFFYGDGF